MSRAVLPERRGRSGRAFVEVMVTVTVVALAVIVAAYIFMPDFQRGVRAIARDVEDRWFSG